MSDYEHQELERKIRDLERRIDDADYEIRRLKDEKAERSHFHSQYQVKEGGYD